MRELSDLVQAWRALPPNAEAVLATVIATEGSVYRRPGARMLLTREGWIAGSISGGCLESDLVQTAFDRTEKGAVVVRYDASAPDDILLGFGLGCNGIVDVLMERLSPEGGPLPTMEKVVDRRESLFLSTHFSREEGRVWYEEGEAGEVDLFAPTEILREPLSPPPALAIFGAGHDAVPLVRLAKELGWRVTVIDGRPAYADAARFPGADQVILSSPRKPVDLGDAAVVVMTHSFAHDTDVLRWLLQEPRPYVGLLGPTHRTERILKELGLPIERLHAPIGLDLGAEGPDEIALAIVAEIQAVRNGRTGGVLKGRRAPLHARRTETYLDLPSEAPLCEVSF